MHELAICQDMLSQVQRIATDRGATRVDRIAVVVGPLSGVEIPLLERAFSIACAGTIAVGAELDVMGGDILVQCRSCHATSGATLGKLTCAVCGDWRVDVRQGDEMLLKSVELSGFSAREANRRAVGRFPTGTSAGNNGHV